MLSMTPSSKRLYSSGLRTECDPYEGNPPVSYLRKNIGELQKRRERVNEKLSPDGVDGPLPPVSLDDVLAPFEHFRRSYPVDVPR
jgi:hypothetical protein